MRIVRTTRLLAALALAVSVGVAVPTATAADSRCGVTNPGDAYPPSSALLTISVTIVPRLGVTVVIGAGWARHGMPGAGGIITLILCSSPSVLGTAALSPTGTIHQGVVIPSGAALGSHHIYASGPDGKGGVLVQATRLTVSSAAMGSGGVTAGQAAGGGTGTASGGNGLPFTGTEIAALLLAGSVAIALGAVIVLTGRRRRIQAVG